MKNKPGRRKKIKTMTHRTERVSRYKPLELVFLNIQIPPNSRKRDRDKGSISGL